MRVLVLAPYALDRAPSQRFRWEQYIEPLGQRGIELEPSCFLNETGMRVIYRHGAWPEKARVTMLGALRRMRDTIVSRRYDLVLVHRESLPVGPAWVERILRTIDVPYVFDFDDAIYLGDTSAANRRLAWLTSAQKTIGVVSRAAVVLAGNEDLATWAQAHNPRVKVVPTSIDTELYRPRSHDNRAAVCIGWTGSMSTIAHLEPLGPILRDLQRECGIRIRVIGHAPFRLPGAEIESLPWERVTELEDLRPIDIGVMPLPDDEWARGKCGLKALQYMALGIPTVLSPVGVNLKIAEGGAALLASSPAEWKQALRSLITDPSMREKVGVLGRRRVEESYSVRAVLPEWESALREAARSRG